MPRKMMMRVCSCIDSVQDSVMCEKKQCFSVVDFLICDYHQFESTGSDFCLLQVEQERASHLGPELHRVHGPVNHSCFLARNSVVAARGSITEVCTTLQ